MSDQQGDNVDDEQLAYEYVSGLLRDEERSQFERRLENEDSLQALVRVWEEQLSHLQDPTPLKPFDGTWEKIEQRVVPKPTEQNEPSAQKWRWAFFAAMAAVFVLLVFPVQPPINNPPPEVAVTPSSVDYVAVMVDDNEQPSLTTLGSASSKTLTLQWQLETLQSDDEDFQLWAKSKRDGQIRSIAILEDTSINELSLSDANWRLITDAESLILTVEEAGGSAIDEPSEILVASGVCIRIAPLTQQG